MHPIERLKCFLEPARLAVAGALATGEVERTTVDQLVTRTGLDRRNVLEALGALTAVGLVDDSSDGFQLDVAALREIARELAEVELPMDPFIGFGMTDEERKVLSRFFHGRTLNEIPSNRAKRLIVLERLALEFDVGRRYPESEVNAILGRFHPDWSSLRRYLVDEGILDRERNEYWRAGGKVVDVPVRQPAVENQNVGMSMYSGTEDFEGATFVRTSFRGATLRSCDVSGVTMRSVEVGGLDIDSHDLFFSTLIVNGVDVVPLVEAELNRQFPGRELQNAKTPEGLRDGWVAVQAAWETTVTNTPPELVDAHVEDEWSLAQTLRHLVLATDAWLRGGIMRMEQPFHEIGQIFTGAAEMGFDISIFRSDAPALEEILAVRSERQQLVTDFLAAATPELLAEERDNPWGGGDWHPSVGDCVRVILEEEWAHLRYIRRDLALLA